jgi:hypothetical protein
MPVGNVYISSDNLVTVDALTDPIDDSYVNDATVTAKLTSDAAGVTTVVNSSITLTYVAASDGKYQEAMPSTVSLTDGVNYYLFITATSGTQNITIRKIVRAGYYEGCEC